MLARVRLPVLARLLRDPGGDRGALTLSYVVVLPVVFLFLMVIVQASFWFLAKDAALAAARQGADAARSLGSTTTAGPAAAIAFARRASGYLLDPSASATASADDRDGDGHRNGAELRARPAHRHLRDRAGAD